jgi:hypothetical protein
VTAVQMPVPAPGVLAVSITEVSPQVVGPTWSGPAEEEIGFTSTRIVTSSVDGGHGALEIVQRST